MKNRICLMTFAAIACAAGWLVSCKKDTTPVTTTSTTNNTTSIPDVYKKIYGASDMYIDGNYIVITTKNLPDHKSPYYKGTTYESTRYEAYKGSNTNYYTGPGQIAAQNLTFRLPLHPVVASAHSSTPLGPIGISLNGVVFFNQYAGNGNKLGSNEINTYDQYGGHPTPMDNSYHYHAEPYYLTTNKGKDALMGFLLDGFPVYGPQEKGRTLSDADLDSYHGHFGITADYPQGIYHYHITAEDPYINGDGFYGTAGTVSH